MGDVTDLYQIPYITDEDLVGDTPKVDKHQAERIDYLFSVNTGPDGKSAYDIYVESVVLPDIPMSEEDWLESLNGDVGASAYENLLPAHQEPVELSNTQFGHLLAHTSHAPLNYYPIGTVIEWAGTRVDSGWLWCDGKGYDYTVNGNKDLGALYSVIGHKYGGSGNLFAVPDKRAEIDTCEYIIYAGGDTSAVVSNWQNPFNPADSASGSMSVGTIVQAVAQPDDRWVLCDGGMYAKNDIGAELHTALQQYWANAGITISDTDPAPVPDLRGRVAIGPGTDGHFSNPIDRPIGRRGGDTRYQAHTHTVNESGYAASAKTQPDGTTKSEGMPMVANEVPGNYTARGAFAVNSATASADMYSRWIAHANDEITRGKTGDSGNMPPYAVIAAYIYAGKPGPFTKLGDIKDTYSAPTPSPATTFDLADGEIPPPLDLENNPPDGYWKA